MTVPGSPPNPLARYYRVPGVHVHLPTRGAFMPPGSLETTQNGEVAISPMRAQDEMLLKSPDALMSGMAIESLLQSCAPGIKAPRLVSSPDLDVLLLAIRAATYGSTITLEPTCPACGAVNETHRSLAAIIGTMTFIEPEDCLVRLDDEVVATLRPHNMEDATRLATVSFEEARKIQAMEAENSPQADRSIRISQSMQRIAQVSSEVASRCIMKVAVPDGEVADQLAIREFYANISKLWTDKIQERLEHINNKGIDKNYEMQCAKCEHTWTSQIEFDPSSFFDSGSSA